MSDRRPRFPILAAVLAALASSALVGCAPEPEIRRYSVSKQVPEALQSEAEATALLGAMVPVGERAWFFKLTGPANDVADAQGDFRAWIESLRFEGGQPAWNLPAGWGEQPGSGMRAATITIPTDREPLEATVIPLPISGPLDEAVAANMNRWRGQVGLDRSDQPLGGASTVSLAGGRQAYYVELAGTAGGGGAAAGMAPAGAGPMAAPGGAAASAPSTTPAPTTSAPSTASGGDARPSEQAGGAAPHGGQTAEEPLAYTVPEGWRPGREGSMRLAAFEAGGEEAPVEITVIRAGGGEDAILRMWLGQIQAEVTDEQVQSATAEAESIEAMGVEGRLYRLSGDRGNATHVVALPEGDGMSLFVKMSGDAETVAAEAEAFEAFVRSLEPKGVGDRGGP